MAEKVVLPKEVAEAIEHLRNVGYKDFGIVAGIEQEGVRESKGFKELDDYFCGVESDSNRHPNELMRALVNGYETEKSALDNFAEQYNTHKSTVEFYRTRPRGDLDAHEKEQERYSNGFVNGADSLAKAYGITIEGVNA